MAHPGVGIKICGLTCVEDALACAQAGANWIGLNFHPGSPRYVTPERAAMIVRALPPAVAAVGVFVDRPPDEVVAIAERAGLQIIQLHGNEPTEQLLALTHFQLIRAFRLRAAIDWVAVSEYLDQARSVGRVPDAVLIDAYVAGQPGGTGSTIMSEVLDAIPRLSLPRLILAGGLTPENVAARTARVRPWMVDVASGVEFEPGRKDPEKVVRFIQAVRSASLGTPHDSRPVPT